MKKYTYLAGILLSMVVFVSVVLALIGCNGNSVARFKPDAGFRIGIDGVRAYQGVDALDSAGTVLFGVEARQRLYLADDSTACLVGALQIGRDSAAPSITSDPWCFDIRELWKMARLNPPRVRP